MNRPPAAAILVAAAQLVAMDSLNGQTLSSATSASLSVTAPTETDYDAGTSAATGNYRISTTCTGSGSAGCRLFIQYGTNSQGQQVDMQYAIVSLGSANCRGAVANPSTWRAVQPTTVVLATNRNRTCVATFRFRVNPLSYAAYPAPGPSAGFYRQRVNFVFTRP